MYAQMVDTGAKRLRTLAEIVAGGARVPGAHRCRHQDRAQGLDARGLSQDADPPDLAARALRDRRHAARRQLDHARADAEAQGDPDGQGAGRSGPRAVSLCRGGDAGRVARPDGRRPAFGQGEVFEHLQLPDADLGRHRRHRLAGRRRGDHEPDPALPLLVRPLRARDDPRLQGRELPPAPGLRHHDEALPGHRRAEGDGAGRAQPLVVAVADDVRAARCRFAYTARSRRSGRSRSCPTTSCASASSTRPCRRPITWASRCPTRSSSGTRSAATTISARSTGTSSTKWSRATVRATAIGCARACEAWEEGAWVREAALAHAQKRAAREARKAARGRGATPMSTRMAVVGSLHPQPARARAQARRQPARRRRGDGDQATRATSTRGATKA